MNKSEIARLIDHAVLKPTQTDEDLKNECEIAKKFGVATVCVKPSHVTLAAELLKNSGVGVSTVIGFPHGSTTTRCKVGETIEAIENGAGEIDMVMNYGKLLSGNADYVYEDIKAVVEAVHKKNAELKVIIEACCLNDEQKVQACKLAQKAGADFVKTSTGFASGGATLEDVRLMRQTVGDSMGVKASGGIKTLEQAQAMVEAGATRLGLSSTAQIFG